MRFVATRGSMSVGASQGGLPPDRVVEGEDAIPADTRRVIERFHDKSHGAMVNVAVVPCSPFSVSRDLMRESASLARAYGVRLHTYLAENDHDIAYSLEKFGCTPAQYAQDPGWTGADVWHAHCVKLDPGGIALFASTRTGVAHCPCSNMRLASASRPSGACWTPACRWVSGRRRAGAGTVRHRAPGPGRVRRPGAVRPADGGVP